MSLTKKNKEQVLGLIEETIIPCIVEDLGVYDKTKKEEVIIFLIENLQNLIKE